MMSDLVSFLDELAGPHPAGLLELRTRVAPRVLRASFFSATDRTAVADAIRRQGPATDVYIAVVPRTRPSGGRAATGPVWSLWADVDDEAAVARLHAFDPKPSIVIRSGSAHGRHAYWLLDKPLNPVHAERANRRLATALGADPQSTDAARILRPPETLNHKYAPPAPVRIERFEPVRVGARAVVGHLPDGEPLARERPPRPSARLDEPLRHIAPDVYVKRLTGITVPRSRKISCPFHADDDPSLHVFRTPERGWYCFGCGRGGSIYDFAAGLWNLATRGDAFNELRRRLEAAFAEDAERAA
jgi:hypothetical protein